MLRRPAQARPSGSMNAIDATTYLPTVRATRFWTALRTSANIGRSVLESHARAEDVRGVRLRSLVASENIVCGIAGIVRNDGRDVDQHLIRRMCDAIRHRGPDEDGFY